MLLHLLGGQRSLQAGGPGAHQLQIGIVRHPTPQARQQLLVLLQPIEIAQEHPQGPRVAVFCQIQGRDGPHAVFHHQSVGVKGLQCLGQPWAGAVQGMHHPELGRVAGLQALAHLGREQIGMVVPLQQQQRAPLADAAHDVAPLLPALGHRPLPDHQAAPADRLVQIQGRFVDAHIPAELLQRFKGLLHPHRGPGAHRVHQHIDWRVRLNHRRLG